jgi:hypothetical protein
MMRRREINDSRAAKELHLSTAHLLLKPNVALNVEKPFFKICLVSYTKFQSTCKAFSLQSSIRCRLFHVRHIQHVSLRYYSMLQSDGKGLLHNELESWIYPV